jgi:hypothetical protein
MLLFFNNAFKGNLTDSIAINPSHIISVYEVQDEEGTILTAIYGVNGVCWSVTDSYLDVVSRINTSV